MTPAPTVGPRFRRAVFVTAGENPSFDYYLAPRLHGGAGPPWVRRDLGDPPTDGDPLLDGALVVFCRYARPSWLSAVRRARACGVARLVDDDFRALIRDRGAPYRWRRRLRREAVDPEVVLARMGAATLASTPALVDLHAPARLLAPVADGFDLGAQPAAPQTPVFAFHATAAHRAEHHWLARVFGAWLASSPIARAEVVASPPLDRLWRGEPRLRVIPHQSWPAYRRDTAVRGRTLLLAPLLDSPANRARSAAKRIDAARCGAALLVSDAQVYAPGAEEAALGMCVPLQPQQWVDALTALAASPERLARLASLNRSVVQVQAAAAGPLFAPAGSDGWWRLA